jgi:UDP-N-acetylglucosamine diphosphorylase/glucosamine-1-phosphate N-acetyltransferase
MKVVLFDTPERISLYPFTALRPVAAIQIGIDSIQSWWEQLLHQPVFILSETYLEQHFIDPSEKDYLYIDARLLPNEAFVEAIEQLPQETVLKQNEQVLAIRTAEVLPYGFKAETVSNLSSKAYTGAFLKLEFPHQISEWNAHCIDQQLPLFSQGKKWQIPSHTNQVSGSNNVFIEEGATVEHCIINAQTGPVYIEKNSLVMEGTVIRGPFVLLEGGVVKMGSKIYGATTVGRSCTVGGEIKNVVFFDFANKAHDGYLGDSVIGSWCNLGAGTSVSNIKNTAEPVSYWNPLIRQWIHAGIKCGAFIGDYSKAAINTTINTGTVAGIGCNLLGVGFQPKYIPDFTWNAQTNESYHFEKFLRDVSNWKKLKHQTLNEREESVLNNWYTHSKNHTHGT